MRGHLERLRRYSHDGGPSPDDYAELDACFAGIMAAARREGDPTVSLSSIWSSLGESFRNPDTMQGWGILKPYGYAGDFRMIDRIYRRRVSSDSRFQGWDRYFHSRPAAAAVRNRRTYIIELIRKRLAGADEDRPIRILSVGCGPAREFAEWHEGRPRDVHVDLLDRDPRALAYAATLNRRHADRTAVIRSDAFHFSTSGRYDLIWSAGLFDYLSDRAFRVLVRRLLRLLKPGGLMTIGNFSPNNPTRDYMEFGLWLLNHRSEETLYRLALDSGLAIDPQRVCVDGEPEGINLFLHVQRPEGPARAGANCSCPPT